MPPWADPRRLLPKCSRHSHARTARTAHTHKHTTHVPAGRPRPRGRRLLQRPHHGQGCVQRVPWLQQHDWPRWCRFVSPLPRSRLPHGCRCWFLGIPPLRLPFPLPVAMRASLLPIKQCLAAPPHTHTPHPTHPHPTPPHPTPPHPTPPHPPSPGIPLDDINFEHRKYGAWSRCAPLD